MPLKFLGTALIAVGLLTVSAWARPLYPRVKVEFQHPVIVNSQTLSPGQYVFQEIESRGTPRVFRVIGPNGNNLTLTSVAIRTRAPESASNSTPPVAQDTEVVLQKIEGKYYLHKIWIQGRTRGWEFEIPADVKSQVAQIDEVVIPGSYDESDAEQTQSSNNSNVSSSNDAQSNTSPSQRGGEASVQTNAPNQPVGSSASNAKKNTGPADQISSVTGCLQADGPGGEFYVRTSNGAQTKVKPADRLQSEMSNQLNRTVRLVGKWSSTDAARETAASNNGNSMLPGTSGQTSPVLRVDRIDVIATNCSQ